VHKVRNGLKQTASKIANTNSTNNQTNRVELVAGSFSHRPHTVNINSVVRLSSCSLLLLVVWLVWWLARSLSQPTHHGHCRLLISLSMYCSLVYPLGLCSRCPTNSYSRYASKQPDPSHSITFITNKPYWFSRLARSVCPVVRQSAFSTVAAATAHNAKSSGRLQAIGALGAAVLVVGMTSFKSMLQYQTTKPIVFDVSCKHNADSNNDKSNAIDS
jgi:hypothetical protein